ncbi:anti-sigma factor [Terrarubrum flagellatum]|uniref:anti-sigma factor family protein n=1 Tax=Terrirubrum flagellatum TaxID=2895980 RepID=UPI00314566CC
MNLPSDPVELRLLLNAYADGELDAATALAMERRLEIDAALADEHRRILALKDAIATKLPRLRAPDTLSAKIAAMADAPQPRATTPSRREAGLLAAGAIIGAALAAAGSYGLHVASRPDALLEALVTNHRRALLAASPVDVASSDRHTVRPWFENRLALSVPAIDLADKGFPLVGGRVDITGGIPVATLVYRAREHLISLSVLAAEGPAGPARRLSRDGFSAWEWREGARAFWVVSDVEAAELESFIKAFRAANSNI